MERGREEEACRRNEAEKWEDGSADKHTCYKHKHEDLSHILTP